MTYDLRTQPYAVGDVLVMQEWALLQDCPIDFQFVFDPTRTVPNQRYITDHSARLERLLPLGWCNPNVRSVSVVADSKQETGYLYYDLMAEFAKHERLPNLQWCPVPRGDYVSVQIRQNPHDTERNSVLPAWVEFLATTDDSFVVFGDLDGIPDLPNVRKSRGPIVNDLLTLAGARAHLGASSGPATLAWFNSQPFTVFHTTMTEGWCAGYEHNGGRGRFSWSADRQTHLIETETVESIRREHQALC